MKNIPLILISVSLNAGAQILMRKGMLQVGEVSSDFSLLKALPLMISNIFLWLAFCCYGLSIVLWMAVLSRVEVSFAYTFSSLGYTLVAVMGVFFLGEHISITRIAGIAVVCLGVILVAKG
jgi:drug/metabolite transporter (DMT)-like permease